MIRERLRKEKSSSLKRMSQVLNLETGYSIHMLKLEIKSLCLTRNSIFKENHQNLQNPLSQHKFGRLIRNMTHVNTILNNIEPRIREVLAKNDYLIYQIYNEQTYNRDLYLVNNSLVPLIKQLKEHTSLNHSGIYFGHLVQGYSKSNIKMEKRFNLSLEGGSFLYSLIQSKYPEIFANLPILKVNTEGEKKFLYGNNLEATDIYQVNDDLGKHTIFLWTNRRISGLCCSLVKQQSERVKNQERLNEIEYLKRRKNFMKGLHRNNQNRYTRHRDSDSKNFIVIC